MNKRTSPYRTWLRLNLGACLLACPRTSLDFLKCCSNSFLNDIKTRACTDDILTPWAPVGAKKSPYF